MRNLIIVGARGFGREIYNLAIQTKGYNIDFAVKGFLDDKSDALDTFKDYPPIISSVEEYKVCKEDVFVVALGEVKYKKIYTEKILAKGGQFITLIHPTAIINKNTNIGVGVLIGQYTVISCDCTINNHVTIHSFCNFGHDIKIGEYSSIGAYGFLGGFSQIEDSVTLHPRVSVMPHKTIKKGAIVGIGSVVMRNVPVNVTVHGNPAKVIFSENENQ